MSERGGTRRILESGALAALALVVILALWPDSVVIIKDDAALLGLTPADFPEVSADALAGMDPGQELSPNAIKGRNTWVLWTAGSQVFTDWAARNSFGISDILKTLDSRRRHRRFEEFGLVNEPGFLAAAEPDEWGVWLDVPADGTGKGLTDRVIEEEGIDERVYGRSTGILGLRLFPNPKFDKAAREKWNAEKYYSDHAYASDSMLVRPYRVGMTCGLCHVAPNPLNPAIDVNEPEWGNLVSTLGNQYFREGRVFAVNVTPPNEGESSSFLWEIFNAQPPGTSDTSRIATDNINNPNAINGIYNLQARLEVADRNANALEKLGTGAMRLPGSHSNPRRVPHILKDGADSIGVPGAASRVYVNIGLFSQYWLTLHNPVIGVHYQQPFEIEYARENSVYWKATESRLANIGEFFESMQPPRLVNARWQDAEGMEYVGAELISSDKQVMARGKTVFAENCAHCHSSKRPPDSAPDRAEWFRASVLADDFLTGNFLSEDRRHSIERIGTNAARALATNAKSGRIWDNFSSETYKELPVAVQRIKVYDPITGEDGGHTFDLEQRGIRHSVGYYRTPSLIGIWSSAPFLHNNTLGIYNGDPTVEGRIKAFEDAAEKLLWPEKRDGVRSVWRTQHESTLDVPIEVLPEIVREQLTESGSLSLGPIPKGTPVNLLASLDVSLGSIRDTGKAIRLTRLARTIQQTLTHIDQDEGLRESPEQYTEYMKQNLVGPLLENSKCPDLVMDRGHTFGAELPDGDKRALIEFLKTF